MLSARIRLFSIIGFLLGFWLSCTLVWKLAEYSAAKHNPFRPELDGDPSGYLAVFSWVLYLIVFGSCCFGGSYLGELVARSIGGTPDQTATPANS